MKLELDRARVPEFVQAALSEETATGGLGKAWKLQLTILPVAYGPFPRDDDPAYGDSAVYIRTSGPSAQSVRVGIRGDAVDR